MEYSEFWKNWTNFRNGCVMEFQFFSNSYIHAENTLMGVAAHFPKGFPNAFDAYVKCAEGGGYLAGFFAPLHVSQAILNIKESAE